MIQAAENKSTTLSMTERTDNTTESSAMTEDVTPISNPAAAAGINPATMAAGSRAPTPQRQNRSSLRGSQRGTQTRQTKPQTNHKSNKKRIKKSSKEETFEDELAEPSHIRQEHDEFFRNDCDEDNDGLDAEFHPSPRHNNRKSTSSSSSSAGRRVSLLSSKICPRPNEWSRLCQFVMFGMVVQVLITIILLIVFLVMEVQLRDIDSNNSSSGSSSNNNKYNAQPAPDPTQDFINVDKIYLSPPPDNIYDFCDKEKFAIGDTEARQTCEEICYLAHCCQLAYDEKDSCWADNIPSCRAFHKACVALNSYDNDPIDAALNDNYVDPETIVNGKALQTTVFPNALVLWGNHNLLPPAPEMLKATCQAAFMFHDEFTEAETQGATLTCHELCHAASCCWEYELENPADRCWTHPNCLDYVDACSVLMEERQPDAIMASAVVKSNIGQAPWNITEYCHADKIQTDFAELMACQEVCLPAECCWNPDLEGLEVCRAATEEPESAICDLFAVVCTTLNEPFTPPTTGLEHNMTMDNEPDHQLEPGTYQPTESDSAIVPAVSVPLDIEDYDAETIIDACWNHDNSIPMKQGHVSLCDQVCHAAACCFDDDKSCTTGLPDDFCDKYAPCEIVHTISETQQLVEGACANRSDLTECVQVCAAATCCFTNNPWKACGMTHIDIICLEYTACEILYQGAQEALDSETKTTTTRDGTNNNNRRLRSLRPAAKVI